MRALLTVLSITVLLASGCPKTTPQQPAPADTGVVATPTVAAGRTALVRESDPLYARVEGTTFKNACTKDQDCVKGGCSAEVCAAEEVNSTCEMPANGFPQGPNAQCGCVNTNCVWYSATGEAAPVVAKQGQPCPDGKCEEGTKCVEYFGIAGPNGPKFTSCEISCADKGATCPQGQACTTIADGPGQVCRPGK